jgi:Periplasmic copper-binding protein (NosD)
MKPIARIYLAAALTIIGTFAAEAQAAGPTDIHACGTITAPGSYVLTRNLTTTGNCLRVSANNVTIDFDGFVITGDGTGDGVAVDATSVTLRNGTITKFIAGIALTSFSLLDVTGNVVERMRVSDNLAFGIGGGSAVVRDSVFTGNGNTAIALNDGSIVTGNRVVGNKGGIAIQRGSRAEGNVILSNALSGLVVDCPSLVLGNTSVDNSLNLFLLDTGCTVDHNVAP